MPSNTAHLTAGTTFKIGTTKIDGLFSTPSFIFDPEMVDAKSFDDTEYASQVPGLQKPNALTFEFRNYGSNFSSALSTVRTANTDYTITFPSGTKVEITGQHVCGPSEGAVDDVENFQIKITATNINVSYTAPTP